MVGQAGCQFADLGGVIVLRPVTNHTRWRCAVGFGKNNVKSDNNRSGRAKPVNQFGKAGARPWPLAQFGQAFIVNINNAHPGILILARFDALIGIKHIHP